MLAAHRPVEGGVAKGEDSAVGGDQPVAVPSGSGGQTNNGCIEAQVAGGPVEMRIAEREDSAVSSDQPVAMAVRGGNDLDDRGIEGETVQ